MPAINRITSDRNMLNGKPYVRGMRVMVSLLLNLKANGMSKSDIPAEYPAPETDEIYR